ncbi:MAG TPA: DinB family protein [Acidimicrobiales bacterium]|nr:DinB family protein [Acidimicrobiales bacterium]
MPALARPVVDERDALLHFLSQQRDALIAAAFELTEDQARSTPTVSALSVASLLQHAAATERSWIDIMLGLEPLVDEEDPQRFTVAPDVSVADLVADYRRAAAETEEIVLGLDDLDLPVPLPTAPWFPPDTVVSARWVLFHLIQETCRHAGHADIIRESIDGSNAFLLIARAEAALV